MWAHPISSLLLGSSRVYGREYAGQTGALNLSEPQSDLLHKNVAGMAVFRGCNEKNVFKALSPVPGT